MKSTTVYRQNASEIISDAFLQKVSDAEGRSCVFLCIGTSKVVSDSLGPRVGSLLKRQEGCGYVYGTEEFNVNASNVAQAVEFIRVIHPDSKIVVVDSAVGDATEVGCVQVLNQSIAPGSATDKVMPRIGDLSLLGVVSMRGAKNFYQSGADRVELVEKMAQVIAESVVRSKFGNLVK